MIYTCFRLFTYTLFGTDKTVTNFTTYPVSSSTTIIQIIGTILSFSSPSTYDAYILIWNISRITVGMQHRSHRRRYSRRGWHPWWPLVTRVHDDSCTVLLTHPDFCAGSSRAWSPRPQAVWKQMHWSTSVYGTDGNHVHANTSKSLFIDRLINGQV